MSEKMSDLERKSYREGYKAGYGDGFKDAMLWVNEQMKKHIEEGEMKHIPWP